jgi:hypothetical protein
MNITTFYLNSLITPEFCIEALTKQVCVFMLKFVREYNARNRLNNRHFYHGLILNSTLAFTHIKKQENLVTIPIDSALLTKPHRESV